MLEDKIRHRIKGLDKLGDKCDYVFHDALLRHLNFHVKDEKFSIELQVQHWKEIDGEYQDVLITFLMNRVHSYYMDNNSDMYALEIYFEEYDGQSQGFWDDSMKVSSDLGFSIVCHDVEIVSVEPIKK